MIHFFSRVEKIRIKFSLQITPGISKANKDISYFCNSMKLNICPQHELELKIFLFPIKNINSIFVIDSLSTTLERLIKNTDSQSCQQIDIHFYIYCFLSTIIFAPRVLSSRQNYIAISGIPRRVNCRDIKSIRKNSLSRQWENWILCARLHDPGVWKRYAVFIIMRWDEWTGGHFTAYVVVQLSSSFCGSISP